MSTPNKRRNGPTPRRTTPKADLSPLKNAVLIYHVMRPGETFEETAQMLFQLVQRTAQDYPGQPRALHFDVEGHRNSEGGFDHDSFELISNFIPGMLCRFLTEYRNPFHHVRMSEPQSDDMPAKLEVFPGVNGEDRKALVTTLKKTGMEIFDGDEFKRRITEPTEE